MPLAELIIKNGDEAQRFYQDGPAIAALRDFFRRHNGVTHADFLRLVCGNDAERFERFIVGKIALNLTANRTSRIEDAKLAMGTSFAAEFERASKWMRERYASGFKNESEMVAAAMAFQNWIEP